MKWTIELIYVREDGVLAGIEDFVYVSTATAARLNVQHGQRVSREIFLKAIDLNCLEAAREVADLQSSPATPTTTNKPQPE